MFWILTINGICLSSLSNISVISCIIVDKVILLVINCYYQPSYYQPSYYQPSYYQPPTINLLLATLVTMPHWSCSSVLCYNNYQSEDASGNKIKTYKLPKDPETQAAYTRIFKSTEKFQWDTGYICAQHWSTGVRESPKHLPDLVLPLVILNS